MERIEGRGLHSFPFQLNLSYSVHRITNLTHECVLELLKLSSNVNECKPLIEGAHLLTWVLRAGLLGAALWGVDWKMRCWVLAGAAALVGVLRVAEDHSVKPATGAGDAGVSVRGVSRAAADEEEEEEGEEEEEKEEEFDFTEDAALAAAAAAGTCDAGVSVVEVSVGGRPTDRHARGERIPSLGGFGRLSVGRLSVGRLSGGAKPGRDLLLAQIAPVHIILLLYTMHKQSG